MALKSVHPKVFNLLKRNYSQQFGSSASKLVEALDNRFQDVERRGEHVISERSIYSFFNVSESQIENVKKNETNLNYLCILLLSTKGYEDALELATEETRTSIDIIVSERDSAVTFNDLIKEQKLLTVRECKDMKILTMDEPIPINQVFVNVNVLKRGTKHKVIRELLSGNSQQNPEISNLGFIVSKKAVPASEIVENNSKLMIWGRLGAGKTTFLKYLALNYDSSNTTSSVYIRLRDLETRTENATLQDEIHRQFDVNKTEEKKLVNDLLKAGKLLILLDGLDEITKVQYDKVRQKIGYFVEEFPTSRVIVTCRFGIYDDGFRGFTEVELASFNKEQIDAFVRNWFARQNDSARADRLISLFAEDESLKSYASNPLQLNLLCLSIDRGIEIPPRNKYALYEGLALALLEKWDNYRIIRRLKTKLSKAKKVTFLSKLAFDGISSYPKKEIWRTWELEDAIGEILKQTSDYEEDRFKDDCRIEVKAIESHHGLLEQLSPGLHAFSSIAFQEYFAATHIVNNPDILKMAVERHLTNRRWRDIFLMVAERLPSADQLFILSFKKANNLIKSEELQVLLGWLSNLTKTCNVVSPSWRAGCLAINTEVNLYSNRHTLTSETRSTAHDLAEISREISRKKKALIKLTPQYELRLTLAVLHTIAEDRSEVKAVERRRSADQVSLETASDFAKGYLASIKGDIQTGIDRSISLSNELSHQELAKSLIELKATTLDEISKSQWKSWADRIKDCMEQYLNIGYNISLSSEAVSALTDYLYINKLLLECLQVDSFAESNLREEIWNYMLLPAEQIPYTLKE